MFKSELDIERDALAFQKGLLSFKKITSCLLNGKEIDEEMKVSELKEKILNYIKENKEAYLSELIEEFDAESTLLIRAINELKEKKLIRRID